MTYQIKTKDSPKSIAFEITRNPANDSWLKKGSKIKFLGEDCIVETIRSISLENGIVKIKGKCR